MPRRRSSTPVRATQVPSSDLLLNPISARATPAVTDASRSGSETLTPYFECCITSIAISSIPSRFAAHSQCYGRNVTHWWAYSRVPAIEAPQLILGVVEKTLSPGREIPAGTVDVKIQQGHGRLKRSALAPPATVGG